MLREESLSGFGIGITMNDFQIDGIRQRCDGVVDECSEVFNLSGSKML